MSIYGNGPSRVDLYTRVEPSGSTTESGIRVLPAPPRIIRAASAPLVRMRQKDATITLARAQTIVPAEPEATLPANVQLRWISAGTANVRAAPNKRSALAGKIGRGGAVHVMWTEPNGWVRIRAAAGEVTGFVHKSLLTADAPPGAVQEMAKAD